MNEKSKQNRIKVLIVIGVFLILFFIILFIVQISSINSAQKKLTYLANSNAEMLGVEHDMQQEIAYRESNDYKNDYLRQEKSYGSNDDIIIE